MIDWSETHFLPKEFACKCGCDRMEMATETVLLLEQLRRAYGQPIYLSSAFRCPDHPIEKKKARPGTHTTGRAVDIAASGKEAWAILNIALRQGAWTGIGVQQKGDHDSRFIHLDTVPIDGWEGYEHIVRPWIWSY